MRYSALFAVAFLAPWMLEEKLQAQVVDVGYAPVAPTYYGSPYSYPAREYPKYGYGTSVYYSGYPVLYPSSPTVYGAYYYEPRYYPPVYGYPTYNGYYRPGNVWYAPAWGR